MSRRHPLRVVSRPLDGIPQRRVAWKIGGWFLAVEAWTEAEFALLHEAEREHVDLIPGIGYLRGQVVDAEEAREIEEERLDAAERDNAARKPDKTH